MKKPSEEAIKAEAEKYSDYTMSRVGFIEGAKWVISQMGQDDVIENVKELRNEYLAKREHMDSFGINNALLLGRYEAYGFFIKKLNAIIEKP